MSVREMLNLPANERRGDCDRCDAEPGSDNLVQLRAIGHHLALCGPCLRSLADLVAPHTVDAFKAQLPTLEYETIEEIEELAYREMKERIRSHDDH